MRALAATGLAAIAAVVGLCARDAGAAPRRTGKVVRVPRPPTKVSTSARTCSLVSENRAVCNAPIQTGDLGVVVDEDEYHGVAIVRSVEPQPNGCGNVEIWMIELALQSGADEPGHGTFVLDFPLEPRARKLPPDDPPRDGERVTEVLDADGDGDGDLRTTSYSCDQTGALVRTARPTHLCTDTWLSVRGRWQRARSERSLVCER